MFIIDFETEKIIPGSAKTPKPVGLAIKHNGKRSEYLSWGHLTLDNKWSKENQFKTINPAWITLEEIWKSGEDILGHNMKFDVRVAMEWFDLPYPEAHRIQDTLFLAFLNDPRERSLELKQLADKYLDMPPEEQDDLKEWILENVKEAKESDWGGYICYAPIKLVKKYAIGDVDRTYKLYKYFKKEMPK